MIVLGDEQNRWVVEVDAVDGVTAAVRGRVSTTADHGRRGAGTVHKESCSLDPQVAAPAGCRTSPLRISGGVTMSGDLSGFSMFELFKTEAESHSAALNEGLLAIEANPADLSHVEQLMRAAHSIKGAARIVDMDIIVELAHAMEDCFVAVQKGTEALTTDASTNCWRASTSFRNCRNWRKANSTTGSRHQDTVAGN